MYPTQSFMLLHFSGAIHIYIYFLNFVKRNKKKIPNKINNLINIKYSNENIKYINLFKKRSELISKFNTV